MTTDEICFLTAAEMAARVRRRELSAVELLEAHLAQIERANPKVNAIVTLVPELALERARAADAALARGEPLGPLHGLPVAHKDLVSTAGIRTTFGSPIYADNVPTADDLIVERLRRAGAITVGKTNTPEFGAGSQTFNPVFGATRNPYDLTKTCGGSSGGAAVALACGMVPIADGSDMGGSLRNPAGYCNVVGLRPSPGRVPVWPSSNLWQPLSVEGALARTAQDLALVMSAISGPDPRAPNSIGEPGSIFAAPLGRSFRGVRVAWSRDLGGLPVDARVTAALEAQRGTFAALGCAVEDADPDLAGADESFKTFRALAFALGHGDELEAHRHQMKDTVVWNTETGLRLTGRDVARATRLQAEVFHRMREFMERYEFLICPVSQIPPFDIEQPYVTEIGGVQMETYIDWMRSCYYISATGHPAASVPCGFTPEGLPVGVQIVGRYRDERGVLELAHAFEEATGLWRRRPAL
jgi:amidase